MNGLHASPCKKALMASPISIASSCTFSATGTATASDLLTLFQHSSVEIESSSAAETANVDDDDIDDADADTDEFHDDITVTQVHETAAKQRRESAIFNYVQQFLPIATRTDADDTATGRTTISSNPTILLQNLYRSTQSKHEPTESIKAWFHFQELKGEMKECYQCWTCYIIVPPSLVKLWKLKSPGGIYHSGRLLGISPAHNDSLDELLDMCGEWCLSLAPTTESPSTAASAASSSQSSAEAIDTTNEIIRFKSKKGAEKSASLNVLLAIEMGRVEDSNELDNIINIEHEGDNHTTVSENPSNRQVHKEGGDDDYLVSLQLHKFQYYGSVLNPDECDYLSRDNPCKIRCVVTVLYGAGIDNSSDDRDATIEITSDWQNNGDDAMHDAFDKLKCKVQTMPMSSSSLSPLSLHDKNAKMENCMSHIFSEMKKRSKSTAISFEETLPKWATAKLESKIYLHELEFSIVNDCAYGQEGEEYQDRRRTALPKFIQLDDVATRVGIVCGGAPLEAGLSADFEWPGITGNDEIQLMRVVITNSKELQLSDLTLEFDPVQFEEGECPLSLMKCFNKVLHDCGKQYGMGPIPTWKGLLDAVTEGSNVEPSNCRTYMFVPLRPKLEEPHASPSIDWEVIYDVVHHKTTKLVDAAIPSNLHNRFFIQPTGYGGRVFVAKNELNATETPSSPLLSRDLSSLLSDQVKERLSKAFPVCEYSDITCCQYYEKVHQYSINHPMTHLLRAQSLTELTYEQHELHLFQRQSGETPMAASIEMLTHGSISNILTSQGLLVPELIRMLPLPRDFLYICRRASSFMPKLERAHTLHVAASQFRKLQQNVGLSPSTENFHSSCKLLPLLEMATTRGIIVNSVKALVKRDHERLETLGDAVLLHFIVLNLFAKLSSPVDEFVLDIFDGVIAIQGKNSILFNAAMQIGLHRLIYTGTESRASWRSKYETVRKISCTGGATDITRKKLSDTVESIIGATYLADTSGLMTVGFLNQIGPDFPEIFDPDRSSCDQAIGWFVAKGTCLKEGFPFIKHSRWVDELEQIRERILNNHHDIHSKLQKNTVGFCDMLASRTNLHQIRTLMDDPIAALLIHSALYDDSLDDQQLNHDGSDISDLEKLAQLRDKIFHVGNATLQLSIVSEIYHLYEGSTSGDFQLMKTALISHDDLAYIFVKNGFHAFLFDTGADAIYVMQDYIKESDLLGGIEWTKNGGWIIPGGVEEFRKRIHRCGCEGLASSPRYMGLAAGRLVGHRKKLPMEASYDLSFSMKCIVGAMTLIYGVHNAWNIFRPFFLELLIVSPEEMRTSFTGVSDVVSNYQRGKR
jgi:dsRNA-specific ribonuclease